MEAYIDYIYRYLSDGASCLVSTMALIVLLFLVIGLVIFSYKIAKISMMQTSQIRDLTEIGKERLKKIEEQGDKIDKQSEQIKNLNIVISELNHKVEMLQEQIENSTK